MTARIAYIAGCMHSGTTMIQRLVGAHADATSVGGIKWLSSAAAGKKKCSCAADTLWACPFWFEVDNWLIERGTRLECLDVMSPDHRRFSHDNRLLVEAISNVGKTEVVVDSSRNTQRLRRLIKWSDIDTYPIHIFKDPRRHASSYKRKNRGVLRTVGDYYKGHLSTMASSRSSTGYVRFSYDAFTRDPAPFLAHIFEMLQIDSSDEATSDILQSWGEQQLHVFGGNRMRKDTSSNIVTDESWRERLGIFEQRFASTVGWPVHFTCSRGSFAP